MSLYESLGLNKNASQDEIRKAYYKLSKTNHPDRGGDPEKFKEINHAHEILSDPERRQMYDMTGSDKESNMNNMGGMPFGMGGMPFGMGGMHFNMNGFGNMFNNNGPQQKQKNPRGPDKTHDINATLSDFYNGREITINVQQQRACSVCSATGSLKTDVCNGCKGQGMKISIQQMGPMIQQTMSPCSDCNGSGKRIIQNCPSCGGKKYKNNDKILKTNIKPGHSNGHKIKFKEECSDSPDYEKPGDVILNLVCKKNTNFEWKGNDLHMNYTISISDALLGFNMIVQDHPNGKNINLSWEGGSLQHDGILIATGLGMPILDTTRFGDLHIHIKIINNKITWTSEQRIALQSIFPDWKNIDSDGIPLKFN